MSTRRDARGREVVEHYTLIWPEGAAPLPQFGHVQDGEARYVRGTLAEVAAYAAENLPTTPFRIERHFRRGYGSTHRLTTARGSQLTIHAEVDGYGRGYSHVLYGRVGDREFVVSRNIGAREAARVVKAHEMLGHYTHLRLGMETF